jgi:hypothetical protein
MTEMSLLYLHIIVVIYQRYVCMTYSVRGCRGRARDRMVVGFTTTCAISAYHH